jgi:hypothetical protein
MEACSRRGGEGREGEEERREGREDTATTHL